MSSSSRHIEGLVDMAVASVRLAKKSYPTGNPKFSVMAALPQSHAEESDPFLMCDYYEERSKGVAKHPDDFPIDWHPHRGMDLLSYLKQGVGRHGDSLGNREVFATPGIQWTSAGSGIEHAEGGGTPEGHNVEGFQIWVNVPSARKMDDPRYGTNPREDLPEIEYPGVSARLLAGSLDGHKGPFITVQDIQIIDFTFAPLASHRHSVPVALDNALFYVSKGSGTINGVDVCTNQVIRLDGSNPLHRGVSISSSASGLTVLCMAGKRLNQPIAWHGPFVMTTHEEIRQTIAEYRRGTFLRKRAPWDFKVVATRPSQ